MHLLYGLRSVPASLLRYSTPGSIYYRVCGRSELTCENSGDLLVRA